MRKKWMAGLLAALALSLGGCSSAPEDVDIDKLAAELAEKVSFTDELAQIDDGMIPMVYDGLTWEDAVLYMGSGATAEEVALFAFTDAKAARMAVQEGKAHIESQKGAFENYVPEEVKRLEGAIVQQGGRYMAVVVTEDTDTADQILKDYHFK